MRALWSDRQNCLHNVSQKVKGMRHFSETVPVVPGTLRVPSRSKCLCSSFDCPNWGFLVKISWGGGGSRPGDPKSPKKSCQKTQKRGAFAREALRKIVANCAKLLVFRFAHHATGAQKCRKFVTNSKVSFGQSYANTPFPMKVLNFSDLFRDFLRTLATPRPGDFLEGGHVNGQNGVDLSFFPCFTRKHLGTLLSSPSFC